MKERDNIIRILKETKKAIIKDDATEIKKLSNQTINTASLTQDSDNILVAVIIYSLGKIFERENYKGISGWNDFYNKILSSLDYSILDIEKNRDDNFRRHFKKIRTAIGKVSSKLRKYIKEVFRKAQINKASRIYEHGISMEQTAKILGITMFELAEYAGKTGIHDVVLSKTLGVKERIKLAMEMFK
jgi:hypothetical protein